MSFGSPSRSSVVGTRRWGDDHECVRAFADSGGPPMVRSSRTTSDLKNSQDLRSVFSDADDELVVRGGNMQ